MTITKENGNYLVKIAKKSIENYLNNKNTINIPDNCPNELKEKLGVFVTLNKNNELRGCIGYPEPILPAIEACINAAISAGFNDPRFYPINKEEFETIDIEVTVLTKPKILEVNNPKEYLNKIRIGIDGLIVEKGFNKGLLLPQVAPENNMDEEEFISHTCLKAGLNPNSWLDSDCKVYTFEGQIFKGDD